MRNIEIKAPLEDREAVRAALAALGARREATLLQRDTFYRVARGWLKLREQEGREAELIAYERPAGAGGTMRSEYEIHGVRDPASLARVLGRALDATCVVEKRRELWRWRTTRIHLDTVRGLGSFIELETLAGEGEEAEREARRESAELVERLGLDRASFLSVPYARLLAGGAGRRPEEERDPARDTERMRRALSEARAAGASGEVPVGALLVSPEGAEIATGRNGTLATADPTAHAEIVALRAAARAAGAARLPGTTLYVTLEPCLMCLGALIQARVARVVFGAEDPKIGAARLLPTLPGGFFGLNHRPEVEGGCLAEEAAALLRDFFRERR